MENNKVLRCPFCKESFVLQKYLKAHISSKHKEDFKQFSE